MEAFLPTARTTVKRLPARGVYDRAAVHSILDSAFVCHVGFSVEGQPYGIPTAFGRKADTIYLHGSSASRMLRTLSAGVPACVTVTHIDGLVLARSGFHHSVNYRSVVILGQATLIENSDEKMEGLRVVMEHVMPGRWDDVRPPNAQELKATTVLSMPLEEVSAKVRTGPPKDDEEDFAIPVWAGVVPFETVRREAIADDRLREGVTLRDYFSRNR